MNGKRNQDDLEARLEKARQELLERLTSLRGKSLTPKEADAVEAAIEDELIALRVRPLFETLRLGEARPDARRGKHLL